MFIFLQYLYYLRPPELLPLEEDAPLLLDAPPPIDEPTEELLVGLLTVDDERVGVEVVREGATLRVGA